LEKLKLLALTNHLVHGPENSIYPLLREMSYHPRCQSVDVATRGNKDNFLFFEKMALKSLYACPVNSNFIYSKDGRVYDKGIKQVRLSEYDAVLLRLPHPVPEDFWSFLASQFPKTLFINNPRGIEITGTKNYLLNFPEFCPTMQHCANLVDIELARTAHPIVLKPTKGYGGQAIVKIDGETVSTSDGATMTYKKWMKAIQNPVMLPCRS
jgi:glutathione synthase